MRAAARASTRPPNVAVSGITIVPKSISGRPHGFDEPSLEEASSDVIFAPRYILLWFWVWVFILFLFVSLFVCIRWSMEKRLREVTVVSLT